MTHDLLRSLEYTDGMEIHLRPELEKLIQTDVQRGPYQSVQEFAGGPLKPSFGLRGVFQGGWPRLL